MILEALAVLFPDGSSTRERCFDVEILKRLRKNFPRFSEVEALLDRYCMAVDCCSFDLVRAKAFLSFIRREDSALYHAFRRKFIEVYLHAQTREYLRSAPLYCEKNQAVLPDIDFDLLIPVYESDAASPR